MQNFYINTSDGNLRSAKILEFSEKYAHAEYFFMERFFEPNMQAFYFDSFFKAKLIEKAELFQSANLRVCDVLKGNDKNLVSLYVFIENMAKNFNSVCAEREKRNEFKSKLIKFLRKHLHAFYKRWKRFWHTLF